MSFQSRWPLVLSLSLLLLGCREKPASPSEDQSKATEEVRNLPPPAPALLAVGNIARVATEVSSGPSLPGAIARDSVLPSMIIRTGQATIEVDSLELGIGQLQRLATTVGGFIANSSTQTGHGQQRLATLEIKVPASRYDEALGGLAGIGKLISSNTTAEDVGEEFVDVTARVSNSRRLEERLVALLATRTGKLDDVLSVERELARVREEIERYEGRLRFLRSKIAVSTLTVTVAEPGPVVGQPGTNVMAEAFKQAWRNFVSVIARGIETLGGVLPVLALGVLGWIGWRKWWRRATA